VTHPVEEAAVRFERRFGLARVTTFFAAAMIAAWACSGCNSGGGPVFVGPSRTVPPSPALVSASIAPSKGAFVSFGCAVGGVFSPAIDFTLSAWSTIDLDHITIQLVDGSHLGGPVIPFPSASLVSQFGSVRVDRGATRVFTLHPSAPCGPGPPRLVSAAFAYWDLSGGHHEGLAQGPWPGAF
jgi:hypothetical protein